MAQVEEGVDFYYNEEGRMVLTAHYLLKRGWCCGNGCKHCPYDYSTNKDSENYYDEKG
jgi:hypothetical protein